MIDVLLLILFLDLRLVMVWFLLDDYWGPIIIIKARRPGFCRLLLCNYGSLSRIVSCFCRLVSSCVFVSCLAFSSSRLVVSSVVSSVVGSSVVLRAALSAHQCIFCLNTSGTIAAPC